MSSEKKIVKRECLSCCKRRALKWFVGDSGECTDCNFNTILSGDYKQCRMCKNWLPELRTPSLCEKCVILNEKYRENERKVRGMNKRESLHECPDCGKISSVWKWSKKSEVCIKCNNKKKAESEGKKRCNGCRCYRRIDSFADFVECEKCRDKRKRKRERDVQKDGFREKEAKRNHFYYKKNASFLRQYSKYYYWNVVKPKHNCLVNLQWCLDMTKKRRINRDGYWHMLNNTLFKGFKNPKIQSKIDYLENKLRNNPRDLNDL